MATSLTPEELELSKKAFQQFDRDGSWTIDVKELKAALNSLGQFPSDEDLYLIINQVDEDCSGEVEFAEFTRCIEKHKVASQQNADETDTIDAFVALGGNADKSGKISVDKLSATIKEFDLMLDVDALIQELDKDITDFINYKEFKQIFS